MPIQIRELIIKATIDDGREAAHEIGSPKDHKEYDAVLRQELVQTCVDEVLRILKQQGRR